MPAKPAKEKQLLIDAIEVAKSQIGQMEQPLGSNSGPMVDRYLQSVGLNPGASWCAAFIYWSFQQAAHALNIPNPVVKTGHVMTHWRAVNKLPYKQITAAVARKNPELVTPGMIMILLIAPLTQAGHTGIVWSRNGLDLVTVEGNSSENGSREGLGVYEITRRKLTDKSLVGFIDYSTKTY